MTKMEVAQKLFEAQKTGGAMFKELNAVSISAQQIGLESLSIRFAELLVETEDLVGQFRHMQEHERRSGTS